jgi:hypothetical protein
MSLVLDDRKLLPAGVHEASMEEIEERFARFQKSERRLKLFRRLREYLTAVAEAACGAAVIVDGSFVMACVDEPHDIDLILVLPENWDTTADLKPYQYNLVSKRRVKREYGFDILVVAPGSADEQEWTDFFGQVNVKWCKEFGWPMTSTKGIVRVWL